MERSFALFVMESVIFFFDEKKPLNIAFPIGARQSEAKTPKSKEATNV